MRIRTKFRIAVLLPLLIALLVGGLFLFSAGKLQEARDIEISIEVVRKANFQLNVLVQEYLLYGGERVQKQLMSAYSDLEEQLARLAQAHEHPLVGSIIEDHRSLGNLLPILLDLSEAPDEVVAGTMLVKFQDLKAKIDQIDTEIEFYVKRLDEGVRLTIMILLLFSGLASSLLLWLMARRLLGGLDRLLAGVERIGKGDLGGQLVSPGKSPDELGRVIASFNEMSARLKEAVFSLNHEIEEKEKAVEKTNLLLSEQEIILGNLAVGVLFLKKRRIIWLNHKAEEISGYRAAELLGADIELFYPDRETYLETGEAAYSLLAEGKSYHTRLRWRRKNGELFWCELLGQAIDPARAEEGSIWIMEDIDTRLELEEEAAKAKNLESLGILAGGIAHDFNNLFQGLLGNISLAKMLIPAESKAADCLAEAEKAYEAGARLTGQLLAFSAGGAGPRQTVELSGLLRETALRLTGSSPVELEFALAEGLWPVAIDQPQIEQVFRHLCVNALESMPQGGRLLISAANEIIAPEAGEANLVAGGQYLKISFADNGCGIGKEKLKRIFDPYYSTKPLGASKGVGLGLTLCHAIVNKHQGQIKAKSKPGAGSTFSVYLPAATSA